MAPRAAITFQQGGAVIILTPQGTVAGSLIEDDLETRGVLLAKGLLRCVENEKWVDEVCKKMREDKEA